MDPINRRSFILKVISLSGGIAAVIISIPLIGVLFEPLLRKIPNTWRSVGKVDSFNVGETVLVHFINSSPLPWTGVTENTASWLRRISEDQFDAFSVNCAHLGCPVKWLPDARLFMCPCHGGVYYEDGSYAAGPPPRGLYKYPVRIRNNEVEIFAGPIPITTL